MEDQQDGTLTYVTNGIIIPFLFAGPPHHSDCLFCLFPPVDIPGPAIRSKVTATTMGLAKSKPQFATQDIEEVLDKIKLLQAPDVTPAQAQAICQELLFNPVVDRNRKIKKKVRRLQKTLGLSVTPDPAASDLTESPIETVADPEKPQPDVEIVSALDD